MARRTPLRLHLGWRDELPAGALLQLPDVRDALRRGEATCRLVLPHRGEEVPVGAAFPPREREVRLDGGLLAHLRAGGRAFVIHRAGAAVDQGSPITSPVDEG